MTEAELLEEIKLSGRLPANWHEERDAALGRLAQVEGRLAALPDELRGMCHWVQNRRGAQLTTSHRNFHFGDIHEQFGFCPYEAMAQVVEGKPDPRGTGPGEPT